MKQLVGTYSQPNRFKIEVFARDGKLLIKEFNQEMPLIKIGENRFSFQFPNAKQPLEIYIEPSANGKSGFIHQYVWAFKKSEKPYTLTNPAKKRKILKVFRAFPTR